MATRRRRGETIGAVVLAIAGGWGGPAWAGGFHLKGLGIVPAPAAPLVVVPAPGVVTVSVPPAAVASAPLVYTVPTYAAAPVVLQAAPAPVAPAPAAAAPQVGLSYYSVNGLLVPLTVEQARAVGAAVGQAPASQSAAPAPQARAAAVAGSLLEGRPADLQAVRSAVEARVEALRASGKDAVSLYLEALGDANQAYADRAGIAVTELDQDARQADRQTINQMLTEAIGGGHPEVSRPNPSTPVATAGVEAARVNPSAAVVLVPPTPAVTATLAAPTYTVAPAPVYLLQPAGHRWLGRRW